MSTLSTSPSTAEIEEQLQRMLSAKRFRNAPNQAEFLALVVRRTLRGKKTPGHVIAKALFAGTFRKDESTDVHVTASNLRGTLKKYFDGEGSEDPVRILLPEPPEDKSVRPGEGEAYTPIFTYHPFQAVSFQYKMAEALLSRDLFDSSKTALHKFGEIIELAPEHIGAHIALAEAWCYMYQWLKVEADDSSMEELSMEALKLLQRVRPRAEKYWKLHAVVGFLFTEMKRLDLAKEPFATALSLSRASTESYPPYLQFLIKSGNVSQGLRLAERYLEARLDDPNAYVAFADILLAAQQYNEASLILETALQVHGDFGLANHRLFLLRLVQRRVDDFILHYDRMAHLVDPLTREAAVEYARKLLDTWPEEERKAWYERMALEKRREEAIAEAISRVQLSLKA